MHKKYVVNKKEILEYHEKELNKLKSENEELKEKVASSDSLISAQEVYGVLSGINNAF